LALESIFLFWTSNNVLPNTLTHLTFGYWYDHSLSVNGRSVLPDKLEYIAFDCINIITNYKAFSYNTKIYKLNYGDITNLIHILKIIDDTMPMPIAEEIIPNI